MGFNKIYNVYLQKIAKLDGEETTSYHVQGQLCQVRFCFICSVFR